MRIIKTGSDFSGVGAFDYAIERVCEKTGYTHKRVFACDWDKYARISYIAAHGEPEYYPKDVYERAFKHMPPLDIYMTSPPCQSFSIAGKRGGKDDDRGILFFNSHEFIQKNKPKTFIFENVKGLLSDDKHDKKDEHGRTFREWLNYLGGKSVNGVPVIFPDENAVPYHIYWTVLNSKEHGVPQNRERVFIVGIRDDKDNEFSWPRTEPLAKRLKDILESEVDPKYFLSGKAVEWILNHRKKRESKNKFPLTGEDVGSCVTARYFKQGAEDPYVSTLSTNKVEGVKVMQMNPSKESGGKQPYQQNRIYDPNGITPALCKDKSDLCIPVLTPDKLKKGEVLQRSQSGVHKLDNYYGTLRSGCSTTEFGVFDGYQIRRLTPLECFRLQDFPDSHVEKCKAAGVSDSQLYKQAGNSITVRVLELIIEKLLRCILHYHNPTNTRT